jgi:hypothetical protein
VIKVGLLLLAALAPDAGIAPDVGIPAWIPQLRPIDKLEGSYPLHQWGDGYVYQDSKFEARVAPDGTVSFKDKHGTVSLVTPWSWMSKLRGKPEPPLPERTAQDPAAGRRAPWLPPPEQTQNPKRSMPQEEVCPPSSSCYSQSTYSAIQVVGSFDLTDEIMRALGQDPYALDKARFLSATFEFRINLAIEARKLAMKKALDHLPGYLDELWADDRYSPRERRRILYELWYETDHTPDGGRAAKLMDAFIKRRLPCGAANGYTSGELEAFGRSHPERPFTPAEGCPSSPAEHR